MRPWRVGVVAIGLAAVGFSALLLSRVIEAGRDPWQPVVGLALVFISAATTINFVWFHYVTIDSNRLQAVRCFGLVRRTIPINDLTSVDTRQQVAAYGLLRPTWAVRFRWAHGVIELGQAYPDGPVREAVALVKAKGIPVDTKLLRYLHIS